MQVAIKLQCDVCAFEKECHGDKQKDGSGIYRSALEVGYRLVYRQS